MSDTPIYLQLTDERLFDPIPDGDPVTRFGEWRPLGANWDRQPVMTTPDIICLHTMVGSLAGTDRMFHGNGYGGVFSHFGIGGDGTVLQWQDTRYRAAANFNGNHRIVSVETADMNEPGKPGPFPPWNTSDGGAVPAWTDNQIAALAHLVAALCAAHTIPCELVPDSQPRRRGVAYHRQGIDGNYPDGRVLGGEVWSTATGKVCPGDRRISQIPTVISRARALMNNQEDDMFTDADRAALAGVARRVDVGFARDQIRGDVSNVGNVLAHLQEQLADMQKTVAAIAAAQVQASTKGN